MADDQKAKSPVVAGVLVDPAGEDLTAPSELRRRIRQPYAGQVEMGAGGNCQMAALDISTSGVGLLSARPFATGQPVTLLFFDGTMRVEGVVSRVRAIFTSDWQIGVQFLEEQPALILAISARA
ncbi:MAG TPA: PilZ domain-containing protein [bacterium]